MAMLTMRAKRFLNKTRKKISANGSETIGFNKSKTKALVAQDGLGYDWSDQAKEGPTNFAFMAYNSSSSSSLDSESQLNVGAYKAGLESVEARLDVYKKNEVVFEEDIKILKLDVMLRDNALTELRKKFKKAEKERDDLKLTLEKFKNSSKNLSILLEIQVSDKLKTGVGYDSQVFDSQVNDKYKTGKGYHVVPPPYIGNFMPPKSDLVLADEDDYVFSESVTIVSAVAISEAKPSELKPKSVSEPLIEDWIFDSEDENETEFKSKQRKSSFAKVEFVKSSEHVKSPRESVKKVENNKQAKYPRKNSQSPRDPLFSSSSKDSPDAGFKPSGEEEKKDAEDPENEDNEVPNTEEPRVNQEKDESVNSTNNINTVSSTVNTASIEDNAVDENLVYGFSSYNSWTLVDLQHGKRAIGTKWVYKNKKDERGIVIRNKARLVIQGYTQEEGIDYERFMPRSRLNQLDPEFPDRVYKVEKAYKVYIKLLELEDVDVYLYRSMIGSLMYLTSSRPDIMFAVCACAIFHVTPKVSHLHVVKRIFRYLKGQPKLGLWYPKESPFDLETYTNSDYAGASLDRKSTIGGCQFLGSRLISWQSKKQTIVANSTTKAEYVAASNCHG
ncbi:putative reverse transcriptase, RNA-dependent DNA polymerase [Tanacetum coccineum]